jgi:probable phosphoglycerate mutase
MVRLPHPVLYLIRHGETDWNRQGRLQGGQDIPLNDLGRAQAAEAAKRLAKLRPDHSGLDYVASPMLRARETMSILRATLSLGEDGVRLDDRLREITFGAWEGLTWPELTLQDCEGARARMRDKWNYVPPEGESYAMLATRLTPWLEGLTQETVAVAHGGVARALMVLAAGHDPAEAADADIRQGQVLVFEAGRMRWA